MTIVKERTCLHLREALGFLENKLIKMDVFINYCLGFKMKISACIQPCADTAMASSMVA